MPKAAFYNIDGDLDYENACLLEWGATDLALDQVFYKPGSGGIPFPACVKGYEALVVEYEQVTAQVLDELPDLRIVALQSIGYNNVDIAAATERGICVTNVPGFCAQEVALHAVGMAIDLVRKITFLDRSVRAGFWNPLLGYKTYRMSGQTFGLVYFGEIPKAMVPMLQGLGLNILVYAPTKSAEYLAQYGCRKADTLDELLEQSDYVSLHTPLMPHTFHLIGEPQLRRMKQGAYLINTARGSVVDEPSLVKALREGWIKGAGIDVIEDEVNETSELSGFENVVITPHAAFASEDALNAARSKALWEIVTLLCRHKRPEHLVNKGVTPR